MSAAATTTRWSAAALLTAYTLVIARLTLWPAASERGPIGLLDRVMAWLSDGRLTGTQIEALANVALFVPAGFLLAVVVGRAWVSIGLCVLASVLIELAQQRYLPSRVPSLADVQHNGLGAVIGAVAAWPLAYALRAGARRPVSPLVT